MSRLVACAVLLLSLLPAQFSHAGYVTLTPTDCFRADGKILIVSDWTSFEKTSKLETLARLKAWRACRAATAPGIDCDVTNIRKDGSVATVTVTARYTRVIEEHMLSHLADQDLKDFCARQGVSEQINPPAVSGGFELLGN